MQTSNLTLNWVKCYDQSMTPVEKIMHTKYEWSTISLLQRFANGLPVISRTWVPLAKFDLKTWNNLTSKWDQKHNTSSHML